jgi:hypothetical protein
MGQRVRDAVKAENRLVVAVRAMCRMLLVHPSGFYAWLRASFCRRALEDQRQTVLLKQAWDDSGEVCGCRKLHPSHGGSPAVVAQNTLNRKFDVPSHGL